MRVECLAQKHNKMSPARARRRTACSGVELINHEATAPLTRRGGTYSRYSIGISTGIMTNFEFIKRSLQSSH